MKKTRNLLWHLFLGLVSDNLSLITQRILLLCRFFSVKNRLAINAKPAIKFSLSDKPGEFTLIDR